MNPVSTTALPDGRAVKLGRVRPTAPRMVPILNHYLTRRLPPPPPKVDWMSAVGSWPMYLNDQLGICGIASLGHQLLAWSVAAGRGRRLVTDDQLIKAYSDVGGYVPGRPQTDQGIVMADGLTYECQPTTGLDVATTAAGLRVALDGGLVQLRQTCHEFGGLWIGLGLPSAWQRTTGSGLVWDVGSGRGYEPYSWGGHAVWLGAYAGDTWSLVTWGQVQLITSRALLRYCDEHYALVDWSWLDGTRPAPSGVNLDQLMNDWRELGGGTLPPPPIPPSPPSPVPPVPPTTGQILIDLDRRQYTVPPGWSPATPVTGPTTTRSGTYTAEE